MTRTFHTFAFWFLIAWCSTAGAETLGDLVTRSIESKAAENNATKGLPPGAPALTLPATAVTATPPMAPPDLKKPEGLRADDIQVYGVIGVGDALRAKVRFKSEAVLQVSKGQSIQGWTVASITPDTVIFERHPSKARRPEQKVVYLSAANAVRTAERP